MERLQQIEEIFQEALRRDPAERDAYVRGVCAGDSDLRREVASLLSHHDQASGDGSWAARAAAQLIGSPALEPGQFLGPYRIDTLSITSHCASGMGLNEFASPLTLGGSPANWVECVIRLTLATYLDMAICPLAGC